MHFRSFRLSLSLLVVWFGVSAGVVVAQTPAQSSAGSAAKGAKRASGRADAGIDGGAVSNGVYRNKTFGLSCKIPAGWVLRTEEMNAPDSAPDAESGEQSQRQGTQGNTGAGATGKVLLAAFSRPPEARGEDVNSSILIAAESAATYPGLEEASQYLGPLTEVAKAQGFSVDEEPYEIAVGTKILVRGDFHKDVGTRVMRQSTLAMLEHGYAVSITVIGGTEDEVEELIDGVSFVETAKK
jgi:hypothetical protein